MSDSPLAGKTALVTGASRGIGRAIALELAAAGVGHATVVRSGADSLDAADLDLALHYLPEIRAIVLVGRHESRLSYVLGMLAIIAATSNIVGGFLITDRMLKMFHSSRPTKP